MAGVGVTTVTTEQCGRVPVCDLPRWALRLLYRLAQLQNGQAYTVTIIMAGSEPVWAVQPIGKVENGG